MENLEYKRRQLLEYYKNQKLLLVALNDSQISNPFLKNGLIKRLTSLLTSNEVTPEVINATSLILNKTEQIDSFLRHNPSVAEIKLARNYGAIGALEKVMKDFRLPTFLGNVGHIYNLIFRIKKEDFGVFLSTSLQRADEPIVIYSSGINNVMREIGTNPFALKADYKNRNESPNYDYAIEKMKNPNLLSYTMSGIEQNFCSILGLNEMADIYALGTYTPKSLQVEELKEFQELIMAYNKALQQLCKQYGVTFVDIDSVGKVNTGNNVNFHISKNGQSSLANTVLEKIYQNKIEGEKESRTIKIPKTEITNQGVEGILDDTDLELQSSIYQSKFLFGYPYERQLQIVEEHKSEKKVLEKVLQKSSRKK